MSDETIGVYLCRCGGNIGDVVDVESIAAEVSKMDGVALTNIQDYLCSSAGQGRIKEDIEAGRIKRVIIASCSPKLHLETFRAAVRKLDGEGVMVQAQKELLLDDSFSLEEGRKDKTDTGTK